MKREAFSFNRAVKTDEQKQVAGSKLGAMDFAQDDLVEAYSKYFDELVNSLRAFYGSGPPDPDDIAQQAFVRVSERKGAAPIRNIKNYIWITARNLMVSAMRAENSRQRAVSNFAQTLIDTSQDPLDPERVLIAKGRMDTIFDCLRQMPERRRTIFILCRIEGFTPAEAAARCGVSRSSAVRHVAIAISQIIEALSASDTSPDNEGVSS